MSTEQSPLLHQDASKTASKAPLQANKAPSKISQSPKIGLQRTSRTSQKLKLLPVVPDRIQAEGDGGEEEHFSGASQRNGVYSQVTKIKDKPARKDAEILGKSHRDLLPRVTAYCTCGSYKMKDLLRWLKDRKRIHNTAPKLFDECLYTPFTYKDWRSDTDDDG
ncbi:hypothetical protein OXX80_007474, partial [Metschnikowia pulcherrima]